MRFVLALNQVLRDWKQQYDLLAAIKDEFSLPAEGRLRLGDILFGPAAAGWELASAEYNAESIRYHLRGGGYILIGISWPEDQPPKISTVDVMPPAGGKA